MAISYNFLLCTERSGSNFITKLLDAHPDICGPTPNHLIRAFSQNRLNYGDLSNVKNWSILLSDIDEYLESQIGEWDTSICFSELKRECEQGSLKQVIQYIFEKEAKAHDKNTLFIKENRIFNFSSYLLAAFPNPKFVYLVRDVRDVALSWKKSPNHPGAIIKAAQVWKEDQNEFKKLYSYLVDLNKIVLVKYEDLVSNTEDELTRICDFLGVDYSDKLLNFYQDDLTISNAEKIKDWNNLSKPIMTNNFKKYIKELNEAEIKYLESECYELMIFFNYELEFKQSPLNDQELSSIEKQEEVYCNRPKAELSEQEFETREARMKCIKQILSRKL